MWDEVTETGPQLSLAVGAVHVTAPEQPAAALTLRDMSEGQLLKTGSSESFTVTVNEQVADSPAPSVAV